MATKAVLFALAFVLLIVPAQSGQDATLAGSYTVSGQNHDGVAYTSRAAITETDGVFAVTWTDDRDQAIGVGFGLVNGPLLSVVFRTEDGVIGMATYRITGARVLVGRWILPGVPGINPETLTPIDPRLHGAERGPSSKV